MDGSIEAGASREEAEHDIPAGTTEDGIELENSHWSRPQDPGLGITDSWAIDESSSYANGAG